MTRISRNMRIYWSDTSPQPSPPFHGGEGEDGALDWRGFFPPGEKGCHQAEKVSLHARIQRPESTISQLVRQPPCGAKDLGG